MTPSSRPANRRGTSNGNSSGSNRDRARRRAWLVDTYGWRLPDGSGIVLCWKCHVTLLQDDDPEAPGQSVTVDRIVPGCRGGRYVHGNIRPACSPCNTSDGGRLGAQQKASRQ